MSWYKQICVESRLYESRRFFLFNGNLKQSSERKKPTKENLLLAPMFRRKQLQLYRMYSKNLFYEMEIFVNVEKSEFYFIWLRSTTTKKIAMVFVFVFVSKQFIKTYSRKKINAQTVRTTTTTKKAEIDHQIIEYVEKLTTVENPVNENERKKRVRVNANFWFNDMEWSFRVNVVHPIILCFVVCEAFENDYS